MSFKLTIEIPDSKLIATLRTLTGHKGMVENMDLGVSWSTVKGKKKNGDARPHGRATSRLTMTGKTAQPQSKIAEIRSAVTRTLRLIRSAWTR